MAFGHNLKLRLICYYFYFFLCLEMFFSFKQFFIDMLNGRADFLEIFNSFKSFFN